MTDYFARRDMVVEFGHILRSPLQGIEGDLAWLTSLLGKVEGGEMMLLACERARSHVQEISRKIRGYVQATAPPKTLGRTFRRVQVEQVARSVVRSFQAPASMKGIRLKVDSQQLRPVTTGLDALELILSNLVDNAVKYSFDNKEVRIRLSQLNNFLQIEVEDFGLMIPRSEIHHIWDRYYRGTAAVDPRRYRSGTGIGLSVAKDLVEELGGSINVTCQTATGTSTSQAGVVRFTVSLPCVSKERI